MGRKGPTRSHNPPYPPLRDTGKWSTTLHSLGASSRLWRRTWSLSRTLPQRSETRFSAQPCSANLICLSSLRAPTLRWNGRCCTGRCPASATCRSATLPLSAHPSSRPLFEYLQHCEREPGQRRPAQSHTSTRPSLIDSFFDQAAHFHTYACMHAH